MTRCVVSVGGAPPSLDPLCVQRKAAGVSQHRAASVIGWSIPDFNNAEHLRASFSSGERKALEGYYECAKNGEVPK